MVTKEEDTLSLSGACVSTFGEKFQLKRFILKNNPSAIWILHWTAVVVMMKRTHIHTVSINVTWQYLLAAYSTSLSQIYRRVSVSFAD